MIIVLIIPDCLTVLQCIILQEKNTDRALMFFSLILISYADMWKLAHCCVTNKFVMPTVFFKLLWMNIMNLTLVCQPLTENASYHLQQVVREL